MNAPISEIKNANTRFFRRVAFYWLIFASGAFCECYVMGWIRPYDTTLESVIMPACLMGYSLALDWLQLPIAFVRHVLFYLAFNASSPTPVLILGSLTALLLPIVPAFFYAWLVTTVGWRIRFGARFPKIAAGKTVTPPRKEPHVPNLNRH